MVSRMLQPTFFVPEKNDIDNDKEELRVKSLEYNIMRQMQFKIWQVHSAQQCGVCSNVINTFLFK